MFLQVIWGGQGADSIRSSAHPLSRSCPRGSVTIRSLSDLGGPGASASPQARASLPPEHLYQCVRACVFCIYAKVNVVLQAPGGSKCGPSCHSPVKPTLT